MNLFSLVRRKFSSLTGMGFNTPATKFVSSKQMFNFTSEKSGKPNRAERGIWLRRNHHWGMRKCFSMKHFRRTFHVHVQKKALYSHALRKTFFLPVSNATVRTIKKYGSFDKFLLMSNSNQFESKIATFIRLLIKKKIKEPATFIPYLPYTNRTDSSKRKTPANVYRNIPSIYIPPESKVKDLSEMYYGTDYLETRQEAMRRKEIQLQIEKETDPEIRESLRDKLDLEKEERKIADEILSLQPVRHRKIRDIFVKIKDNPSAKYHFMKVLEKSENQTKSVLQDRYRHFSEDYPEVQLILQHSMIEKDKAQKSRSGKNFTVNKYEMGEAYMSPNQDFNPERKKHGKIYSQQKTKSSEHRDKKRTIKRTIIQTAKKLEN